MGYEEADIEAMGKPLLIRYDNFLAVRILFIGGAVLCLLALIILCRRYKALCRDLETVRKLGLDK